MTQWGHRCGGPPNVYVMGAPKCGTSTLYSWLTSHPGVADPRVKEPHHYFSPFGQPMSRERYLGLFDHPPEVEVAVDGSVWYLHGRAVLPIITDRPDARFIVCLRDPAAMVPSLHSQKLFTGHETVADLAEAWELSPRRAAGERVGIAGIPDGDPTHMAYMDSCALGAQVQDLLDVVDRDRVLFVTLGEIAKQPSETWERVQAYLDLEPADVGLYKANPSDRRRRSQLGHRVISSVSRAQRRLGLPGGTGLFRPLVQANLTAGSYSKPEGELAERIRLHFAKDRMLLEDLTGCDLG